MLDGIAARTAARLHASMNSASGSPPASWLLQSLCLASYSARVIVCACSICFRSETSSVSIAKGGVLAPDSHGWCSRGAPNLPPAGLASTPAQQHPQRVRRDCWAPRQMLEHLLMLIAPANVGSTCSTFSHILAAATPPVFMNNQNKAINTSWTFYHEYE